MALLAAHGAGVSSQSVADQPLEWGMPETSRFSQSQSMAEIYFLLSWFLWAVATVVWAFGFTKTRKRFDWLSRQAWKKREQSLRRRLERAAAREAAIRERRIAAEERARQRRAEEARRAEQRRLDLLRDPNRNTSDHDIHWARLQRHGYSRYRGETEFMGPRGGVYTVTANGNRNYR